MDDELKICRVYVRMLRDDHDVVVRNSGIEALELFESGYRFDAILCDLQMPGMTGAVFYANLLRLAPDQVQRLIIVSGNASSPIADFVRSNLIVEKPFDPVHVKELVSRVVSAARADYFPRAPGRSIANSG